MQKDIIELIKEQEDQASRNLRRALIICPGAIGDCLLTLPLAQYLRHSLNLGGVDLVGRTEYIDFYPGRTCIDSIRSVESIDFHRLFTDSASFTVNDHDTLISSFSRYECIVSFMGVDDPHFERNLIFTVNCSHPVDITMIPMSGDSASSQHISSRYIAGFAARTGHQLDDFTFDHDCTLITPHKADLIQGRDILTGYDIDSQKHLVMIHPGSGGIHKSWNLRNFLDLADALTTAAAADIEVAFLLGPAEMERLSADQITRIQSTCQCITDRDLKDVVQMLACSDCFVGNDSGLTHIAGAMGLPTIAVFGPTDPSLYGPLGPQVHIHRIDPDRFSQPSPLSVRAVSEAVLHYLSY